jgi:hypothetical protein
MVWIIAIGILIFLGLKFPQFGKFTLIGGGIIILIIALIITWSISDSNQKQKVAKSLIPVNQIELSNLRLNKGFSLYQLSGEVKNNSAYQLEDITLAVKAYDCPGNTITNECTIIGEDDDVSTYIEVPSNQVRSLNDVTYVNLDNMPPVRGNFLWSYDLVSTIAKQP